MATKEIVIAGFGLRIDQILIANVLCLVVGGFILLNQKREPIKAIHVGLLLFFIAYGFLAAIASARMANFYAWSLFIMVISLSAPRIWKLVMSGSAQKKSSMS